MTIHLVNDRQRRSLERVEKRTPEAIVIGWSDTLRGPQLQMADGEILVVAPTGYLRKDQ